MAMLYTGRNVAATDVTKAMPSITSHERGPNTKAETGSTPASVALSTAQVTKHAIIERRKQVPAMIADSE